MNKQRPVLDYVDSIMVVDKNFNIIHTSRANPRFGNNEMVNEYNQYYHKRFFEVYPNLDPKESTMVECLKTGKITFHKSQVFTDLLGRIYHTKNITYPIIRYGEIVGAIELSQDITSIGDLDPLLNNDLTKKKAKKQKEKLNSDVSFESILTINHQMIENIRRAKIFALNDNPVLIYGETGTGKEMFVEAMVKSNEFRKNKFIIQNCAAIPETLFESILFGSSKGAFTDAKDKVGLFEMADGGVFFLDELNSMPIHLQAKLLRFLQDGKIRPIGSSKEKKVNVKIIVAINQNPTKLIKEKLLREDLFYRLSSNIIHLVPLRERKEDITLYIDHFINHFNKMYNKKVSKISTNLRDILLNYDWPGNVRELKHIIESMVNVSDDELLTTNNLPIYLKEVIHTEKGRAENREDKESTRGFKLSLQEMLNNTETDYIIRALKFTKGNVTRSAELLQLPRQTLKYKIDKLNIDINRIK